MTKPKITNTTAGCHPDFTDLSVDDVLMLVMMDNTVIGRRIFNLLSECRVVCDDPRDEIAQALIHAIDDILTPVGDAREGLLGLFHNKPQSDLLDKGKWIGPDSETKMPMMKVPVKGEDGEITLVETDMPVYQCECGAELHDDTGHEAWCPMTWARKEARRPCVNNTDHRYDNDG